MEQTLKRYGVKNIWKDIIININNMNEEKDYNPEGCLSLASEAIQRCFTIPVYGDTYEQRIEFANSKMIELFCDCTTNFDASKLRKQIISFNSK